MMEIRIGKCPNCGSQMIMVDGSQRTTKTMIYYDVRCPNCNLTKYGNRPRRAKR